MTEPADISPDVDGVALLLRTRTTGDGLGTGLGADTGPDDATTFTENTRPTVTEVESVIETAANAVLGRLTGDVPAASIGSVKHAVALYSAVLIEASFFREQANDEAVQLWRDLMTEQIAQVNRAIAEATPFAGSRGITSLGIGSIVYPVALSDPGDPGI